MCIEITTAPLQNAAAAAWGLSVKTQDEVARLVPADADDLPQLLEIENGNFAPAPADQAIAGRDALVMRLLPSKFGA